MAVRFLFLLFLAFILSGCAGDGPTPKVQAPADSGASNNAGGLPNPTRGVRPTTPVANESGPPAWKVGDFWTYKFESRMRGTEAWQNTFIVVGETADEFQLGADGSSGVNQSFLVHMPALGPVRKPDYAVHIHGNPVLMVQFPLEEGKEWGVDVRGMHWDAEATKIPSKIGDRSIRAWRIDYLADDKLQYRIEWSPDTGWFTKEELYFGATTPIHKLLLQDWGRNLNGSVVYFQSQDQFIKRVTYNGTQSPDAAGVNDFAVSRDNGNWLIFGVFFGGGTSPTAVTYGECRVQFLAPDQSDAHGMSWLEPCATETRLLYATRPITEGNWKNVYAIAGLSQYLVMEVLKVQQTRVTVGGPPA